MGGSVVLAPESNSLVEAPDRDFVGVPEIASDSVLIESRESSVPSHSRARVTRDALLLTPHVCVR